MFPFVVFWFFLVFPTSQHCSLLSPLLLPSTITEQKAAQEAGTVPTCFFPRFSKVPWTSLFLHRDHGHTPAVEVSLQMHCKGTDNFGYSTPKHHQDGEISARFPATMSWSWGKGLNEAGMVCSAVAKDSAGQWGVFQTSVKILIEQPWMFGTA